MLTTIVSRLIAIALTLTAITITPAAIVMEIIRKRRYYFAVVVAFFLVAVRRLGLASSTAVFSGSKPAN